MMAGFVLGLAFLSGVVSAVGFIGVGAIDTKPDPDDLTGSRERQNAGLGMFAFGVVAMATAIMLAFLAGSL